MKKVLIIVGIIVVLVIISYLVYNSWPRDIAQMDGEQFGDYNLRQRAVKKVIGSEPVISETISPMSTFNQENYNILVQLDPACAGKLNFGDTIRVATFYTPTREIGAIWLVKDKKIICVAERPENNPSN